MKKIFTLLLGLFLACSANAQTENLPVAGGWNWSVPMFSCTATFSAENAELGLCSTIKPNGISLTDYKGIIIEFDEEGIPEADAVQVKAQSQMQVDAGKYEGIYIPCDGTSTLEVSFDEAGLGGDPVITVLNLQAKVANVTLKIASVNLIDINDRLEPCECSADWNKTGSWGVTAESTVTVLSFTQYAQLGCWSATLEEGISHTYTFYLGSDGIDTSKFQWKYTDADGNDQYKGITVNDDGTISYTLKESYKNFSLQSTTVAEVEILSITRTVATKPEPIVLDENGEVPELGDMADLKLIRTFNLGWNTFCIPTYMTPPVIKTHFGENVKVFKFTDFTNGKLNFAAEDLSSQYTWVIDGYNPVLLYISDNDAPALVNSGFTLIDAEIKGNRDSASGLCVGSATVDQASGVEFQGTYTTISGLDLWGLYGVTAEGNIQVAGQSATMKGYRAYFKGITEEAAAKGITMVFDGVTTGISEVTTFNEVFGNSAVYNLNGQRVTNSAAPGIYIRNGKKYIQK